MIAAELIAIHQQEVLKVMTPQKKPSVLRGVLSLVLVMVIAVIVLVIAGRGSNYTAPSSFTVSNSTVASVVTGAINNTSYSPGLHGQPQVNCSGETSCQITYTVKQPTASGGDANHQLEQPTRQIWKALFEDSNFQHGTITVKGPFTSAGGANSNAALFTLSCDRTSASKINWDNADAGSMQAFCTYNQLGI
jgi:hypothetical protein